MRNPVTLDTIATLLLIIVLELALVVGAALRWLATH